MGALEGFVVRRDMFATLHPAISHQTLVVGTLVVGDTGKWTLRGGKMKLDYLLSVENSRGSRI